MTRAHHLRRLKPRRWRRIDEGDRAMRSMRRTGRSTKDLTYTMRLQRLQNARWKQILDVQRPYRWNLHRLDLAHTLEVGCGIGRNLRTLSNQSVGVDHNPESVALARASGLNAYSVEQFEALEDSVGEFDSLLLAHVVEHMTHSEALVLIERYLPRVKSGGKLVLITPQEVGYRSDDTHVRFVDLNGQRELAESAGLSWIRGYSFPFARPVGKIFRYNEFVGIARKS